jgi:hypothetical protein
VRNSSKIGENGEQISAKIFRPRHLSASDLNQGQLTAIAPVEADCQDSPSFQPFKMAFARSLERQVLGSAILPLNGDSETQAALSAS